MAEATLNEYEMLYILHPRLTEDGIEQSVERVSGLITSNGGEVLTVDNWGRRRLAYPIKHELDGTYVLTTFKAPPTGTRPVEQQMQIAEDILRYLLIRGIIPYEGPPEQIRERERERPPRPEADAAEGGEPAAGDAPAAEGDEPSSEAPAAEATAGDAPAADISPEAEAEATDDAPEAASEEAPAAEDDSEAETAPDEAAGDEPEAETAPEEAADAPTDDAPTDDAPSDEAPEADAISDGDEAPPTGGSG